MRTNMFDKAALRMAQNIRKGAGMDTKESAHTPGPWSVGKNNFAVNDRFITDKGGNVVAYCDLSMDQARINARLIAAAPDLLLALKAILPPDGDKGVGEWWGLSEQEQRERIREAIAKAEGL